MLKSNAAGRQEASAGRADPDGSFAAKARQSVAEISQRWPEHPEAQLAQAQLLYNIDRDYAGALNEFQALQARLPNHPKVNVGISSSLKRLNRASALAESPEGERRHQL